MARPKLRNASRTPPPSPASPALTLAITGVVVTRAQLVAALKPFLPQLSDIEPFEDGERFLLVMNDAAPAAREEET